MNEHDDPESITPPPVTITASRCPGIKPMTAMVTATENDVTTLAVTSPASPVESTARSRRGARPASRQDRAGEHGL